MGVIYGYGCITTAKTRKQIETTITKTKAYRNLEDKFNELSWNTDNIYVDVLNGNNLKRLKLISLMQNMKADDILYMLDLNATGKKSLEVAEFYQEVINGNINLLIPDNTNRETGADRFSTCDYNGNRLHTEQELYMLLGELRATKVKDNRGKYGKPITEDFLEVYWQYENYFIKEETALRVGGNLSKAVFYKWASQYENGETQFDYIGELQRQDALYNIGMKPKRHGKKQEWFDKLTKLVDIKGMSLEDACKELEVPYMHDIDYKRYKLKTGRKAMAQALFDYCKEEIGARN